MKKLGLLALLAGMIAATTAAAEQPGWISDTRTDCKVWNPNPQTGETLEWSGACIGGFASGSGVLQWYVWGTPGERDEGEFRDGKLNGHSVVSWANGNRYDGEWREGEQSGRGIYSWANGGRYEGEWRDGQPSGRGTSTDPDGAYEGEFREGKRNGRGIQTWTSGSRYEGEYRDGKPHGIGSLYDAPSRQTFNGIWHDGCFRDGDRRAAVGVPVAECR